MVHGHLPDLVLGGCSAWPLPADETCAGVARAHLRVALMAAKVPGELVEDVTLAASELVTNGLRHGIGGASVRAEAAPGRRVLELWAYHRGLIAAPHGHVPRLISTSRPPAVRAG